MERNANIVHEHKNDRIKIPRDYRTDWRWRNAPLAPFCRWVVDARKSKAPEAWRRLQEQFPHACRALGIYEDRDENVRRWQLEAALISDATDEEIGAFFTLAPEVAATYENLFFDVRRFMRSTAFLRSYILGPPDRSSLENPKKDIIAKVIGGSLSWSHLAHLLSPVGPPDDRIRQEIHEKIEAFLSWRVRQIWLLHAWCSDPTQRLKHEVYDEAVAQRSSFRDFMKQLATKSIGVPDPAEWFRQLPDPKPVTKDTQWPRPEDQWADT